MIFKSWCVSQIQNKQTQEMSFHRLSNKLICQNYLLLWCPSCSSTNQIISIMGGMICTWWLGYLGQRTLSSCYVYILLCNIISVKLILMEFIILFLGLKFFQTVSFPGFLEKAISSVFSEEKENEKHNSKFLKTFSLCKSLAYQA